MSMKPVQSEIRLTLSLKIKQTLLDEVVFYLTEE